MFTSEVANYLHVTTLKGLQVKLQIAYVVLQSNQQQNVVDLVSMCNRKLTPKDKEFHSKIYTQITSVTGQHIQRKELGAPSNMNEA